MRAPPGYRILARLAAGGMAEVLLAQRVGAEGVSKTVVLKHVRPDLAGDPESVQTLLEEARLSVELSHANIPAVFELGRHDDAHFLVMEYVRGWDLSRVLGACARGRTRVPPAVALQIAAEIAKALTYAHERRDATGALRGIVHRDVSPPNVLLSVEGEVKLADFGIARAAAAGSPTSPWQIKGKLPYMSPEQASGATVDARSDLFSLGVVLFEMLTARRLFRGDSDAELIAAVRAAAVPAPSASGAVVPPEVDALVAKALSRDPAERFQTARAMHVALRALQPDIGPEPVAAFVTTLGLPAPPDPAALAAAAGPADLAREPSRTDATVKLRLDRGSGAAGLRRQAAWLGIAAAVGFGAGAAARALAPKTARLEVRSATPDTTVWIDGVERGPAPVVVHVPRARVEIKLHRDGYAPFVQSVDLSDTADVVVDAALDPLR